MNEYSPERWNDEYELLSRAGDRILRVIDENPVDLEGCAEILETVAQICEEGCVPMSNGPWFLRGLFQDWKKRNNRI